MSLTNLNFSGILLKCFYHPRLVEDLSNMFRVTVSILLGGGGGGGVKSNLNQFMANTLNFFLELFPSLYLKKFTGTNYVSYFDL